MGKLLDTTISGDLNLTTKNGSRFSVSDASKSVVLKTTEGDLELKGGLVTLEKNASEGKENITIDGNKISSNNSIVINGKGGLDLGTVDADNILKGKSNKITGALGVEGNSALTGTLNVTGDTTITGQLTASSEIKGSSLTITNNISSSSITTTTLTVGSLIITGATNSTKGGS